MTWRPQTLWNWGHEYRGNKQADQRRSHPADSNGTLDERLYALKDANWNTIALADTSGDITERFAYSAYGVPLFLDASFIPQSSATSDWESRNRSHPGEE